MSIKKAIAVIIYLFWSSPNIIGQDCASPLNLCNEELSTSNESQMATPFNSNCLNLTNSVVYQFTTNNNTQNPAAFTPYEVNAQIITENCEEGGLPLDLSAAIFEPVDPNDACGVLTEIATCVTSQDTLDLASGTLNPNTSYLLVVGYNSSGAGSLCEIDVLISGAPLTIDACCDANISLGLSASLTVTGATVVSGQEDYVWQPASTVDDFTSPDPVATPEVTTLYTAEGFVGDCLETDQIVVTVGDAIQVKNTFSPNGDGINDTWSIDRIENFDSALITVFDRWGQEVYKTIGYASPWDGTNEDRRLPTGTYYYVIELNSLEVVSEPFVGFVVIIH